MIFFGGVVIILIGLLYLFAGDLMWSWQKFGNSLDGEVSRRGDAWEIKRVVTGILMLLLGVAILVLGVTI